MDAAKVPILLVDDRPGDLLALEAVLESPGYDLVSLDSGPGALKALEERDFALVLLDVLMPGMDGMETAEAIRRLGTDRHTVPIIFVTGFDRAPERISQAYAGGAVDFVQKPIEPVALRSKVAVFAEMYRTRLTAAQLFESEERFHRLVDAVTDYAIFMLDESGRVATWNPGAEKIKGYRRDEILGRHFSVFYTPEDRAQRRPERILETVRSEGRFEEEGWRVRKDGSRFWGNVTLTALRDKKGEVTGFAKVTRDLTAQRASQENERRLALEQRARAASDAERSRLLALLEQLPAVVNVLRGEDLVFEFAHPKAIAALGGRELVGKPLLEAIPEYRDQPEIPARIRRVFETGKPAEVRAAPVRITRDGVESVTYWDSVNLPIYDTSGAIEGVMTFDLDVTDAVNARRELERVSRAKDEFLATMSHELRTPLNAIHGWSSILRRKPRQESTLERGLEVIERNAKAQTRLVNDLLDMSRIISGKLDLKLIKIEVFPLILCAAEVIRPAADAKGVRLVVDVDPSVGEMMADPDRLQQIVWNLLSNAVRFTPKGGCVTLTGDRAATGISIRVEDTGIGIAPEHLLHIFERFRQVDSSTTRAHGGLGLGLAIVRYLVEAHGGTVEGRSEGIGHGSEFSVRLPIRAVNTAKVEIEPVESRPGDAVDEPVSSASLVNVRVLVVDDDADSRELVGMVLQGAGAQVTAVASAPEAFEALHAHGPFEIILSDIGMPEADGYSLMRSLRASGANVPAIALTAYARTEDAQRAKSAGFQAHLAKPVDTGRLIEAVRTWSSQTVAGP